MRKKHLVLNAIVILGLGALAIPATADAKGGGGHVRNLRLQDRFVRREFILDAVDSYELVEAYPEDKYLPSYLVLARRPDDAIHVLFGVDVESPNVRVVTAYRPSPNEWSDDLKARRTP